jgi:hypothetical protein
MVLQIASRVNSLFIVSIFRLIAQKNHMSSVIEHILLIVLPTAGIFLPIGRAHSCSFADHYKTPALCTLNEAI